MKYEILCLIYPLFIQFWTIGQRFVETIKMKGKNHQILAD